MRVASIFAKDAASVRTRVARPRDRARPSRFLDPMPDHIDLCLTLLKHQTTQGRAVGLRNQMGGHDWTHRFPAIKEAR
ncbi:bifunctional non-homologous end joining protein LigD [Rhizobium mongolense]|uniref:Bifunctional non-homologous end joining protein LigD n=1 Tax=Rhizobium mongolense TaxID=57676 RepID=A0ABR6IVZ1_9HYPH|nr:bifunctional non-homologous end joining protein LigD [Rhizobium mongolense]